MYFIVFICTIISCNINENDAGNNPALSNLEVEKFDEDAKDFLKSAAQFSIFEIEAGKLAEKRSRDIEVKSFASRMVTENTRLYNDLKKLAADNHLLLPVESNKEHLGYIKQLNNLQAKNFNSTYLRSTRKTHYQALIAYQKAGKNTNRLINSFAISKTELLKEQFLSANNISKRLK